MNTGKEFAVNHFNKPLRYRNSTSIQNHKLSHRAFAMNPLLKMYQKKMVSRQVAASLLRNAEADKMTSLAKNPAISGHLYQRTSNF